MRMLEPEVEEFRLVFFFSDWVDQMYVLLIWGQGICIVTSVTQI